MLALLAYDGLTGFQLSRIAQSSYAAVYLALARMEYRNWLYRHKEGERYQYTLTAIGRSAVKLILGVNHE